MTSNKLVWVCLCCLLIFAAFEHAAASKPGGQDGKTQTSPAAPDSLEPAYGDMIIRGSIGDASVLLPVLASDSASFDITGLIYNGLVKYDKDILLVGDLATRWQISEDNLRIRFFLRPGVRWHDGAPFTAKDVEYTYKVYVDPNTPTAYATDFLKVKEFHVLDPLTCEAIYEKPYAPALASWSQGMLPSHLLENQEITKSPLQRNPIGTGPYKFKEWKTGEKNRAGQLSRIL